MAVADRFSLSFPGNHGGVRLPSRGRGSGMISGRIDERGEFGKRSRIRLLEWMGDASFPVVVPFKERNSVDLLAA